MTAWFAGADSPQSVPLMERQQVCLRPNWSMLVLKNHQVRKGQKLLALQIGKFYPHRKKHSFQEMGLKKGKGMLQPIILPKQYSTTDLNCQEFNLRCFWLVNQQVIRIHPKSPLAANAICGPRPHGQDAPHHGSVEHLRKIEDPYGKTQMEKKRETPTWKHQKTISKISSTYLKTMR